MCVSLLFFGCYCMYFFFYYLSGKINIKGDSERKHGNRPVWSEYSWLVLLPPYLFRDP